MQNSIYICVYVQRIDGLIYQAVYPFLGLGYYRNGEGHVLSL